MDPYGNELSNFPTLWKGQIVHFVMFIHLEDHPI